MSVVFVLLVVDDLEKDSDFKSTSNSDSWMGTIDTDIMGEKKRGPGF